MAAGLTALVIIMFLGNLRLSLIILAAIPLSIVTAVLFIKFTGQTLNTMTLGGFALAIGILVDNGTVVIENIERHVAMNEPLHQAIVDGRGRGGGAHVPVDVVHLHRLRAGIPAAGHRKISLLAAVALGHRRAAREPGALLHDGAGAVQLPHGALRACLRDRDRSIGQ